MPDALAEMQVSEQAFESRIFEAPVWKLPRVPDMPALLRLVHQARADGVALMSCRIDEGVPAGNLEAAGFRRIEKLVTFERPLDDGSGHFAELAHEAEAAACAEIGARVFTHDRYHRDPEISKDVADEIKRQWVLNGVLGRADAPIVARVDGEIAGFNLCLRREDIAIIDLIGVARAHQGKGLGRALVDAALGHYEGSCRVMQVGTQDTNWPSIALYERAGFVPVRAAVTFHWTPPPD